MKKVFLLALTMFSIAMSAQQLQTPNLKFGKPTQEELTMTTYDRDTSAVAVVLCQLTDVNYSFTSVGDLEQNTFVKTRIKILKPEGKKYADFSFHYYASEKSSDAQEEISGLKVITYNMENGKLKKTTLPGKMMFDKKLSANRHSIDCSAADVKVGSVIEVTYKKWSNMWYTLDDYYAQKRIPVAYCHYCADVPNILQLSVQYTKRGDFTSNTSLGSMSTGVYTPNGGSPTITTNKYEATGRFLPALKDNDFLFCPEDYSAHVSNELQSIQIPGQKSHILSEEWSDVDNNLLNTDEFGSLLNNHSKLNDEIAASGIANITDFKAKVAALYQLMCKHVKWNGKYRLVPDRDNNPLKSGSGSSADLNMLFISMLNDLGVTNYPVILSTRSNGELSPIFANLEHLNAFVIAVTDGTNTYYIDSSIKDGYIDVLPAELLVDRARMIGKKFTSQWVNLQDKGDAQTTIAEKVTIDPQQGVATTNCSARLKGNASASIKSRYHAAKDSTEWISKMASDNGITIQSYSIKGPETFSPETNEDMVYTRQLDTTDSLIYITPFPLRQMDNNPFSAEKRDMPFEFPYRTKTTYIVNINVPDGYKVEDLPHSLRATTPDGSMVTNVNFKYDPQLRKLQIMMKYDINKLFFKSEEYPAMKQMFDKLVEVTNSTIVLKKE